MADIDNYENAMAAEALGFDYVSTTLRGFTIETKDRQIPDFSFIEKLIKDCKANVIVEGGIWEREQLEKISAFNPYGVVIGTSITRPKDITRRFAQALHLK